MYERCSPGFRPCCRHLLGFSFNPRFLRVLASDYSQRRYGTGVRDFSDSPGKPNHRKSPYHKSPPMKICDKAVMLPRSTTTHENRIYKAAQTAPATRAQERPKLVAQGLHRLAGIAKPRGAQTMERQAVAGRAAPGDLQPAREERAQEAPAHSSQRARAAPTVRHPAP
jgi:hypothetical protein